MKRRHAGLRHAIDEPVEAGLGVLVVDADAALDRDREGRRRPHRRNALGDEVGLAHQAGAEAAALHPIRRTAEIEIDLVIAELGADARGLGELAGSAPPSCSATGCSLGVEAEQPLARAVQHRIRRHHLGIEQGAARKDPMEIPAAPVGPVHHRRDAETMRVRFQRLRLLDGIDL